jgi:hypothetical protein
VSTGYDEAVEWLATNAKDWRLMYSLVTYVPAYTLGGPTGQKADVRLIQWKDEYGEGPTLEGTGDTILSAVQNAVGGLR